MSDRFRHSLRFPLLPAGGGLVILLLSMVLLLGGPNCYIKGMRDY